MKTSNRLHSTQIKKKQKTKNPNPNTIPIMKRDMVFRYRKEKQSSRENKKTHLKTIWRLIILHTFLGYFAEISNSSVKGSQNAVTKSPCLTRMLKCACSNSNKNGKIFHYNHPLIQQMICIETFETGCHN